MKRSRWAAMVVIMTALPAGAQTAPDAAELTRLLKEFLAGASRNDAAVHDRFWAEDLIYTRSAGKRIGKAEIMADVRQATAEARPSSPPLTPKTSYTAEDIRIQQYGDTALVAFRLVGTTEQDGKAQVANFLNTGTFRKRNGQWRVVGWQATRLPRPEDEAKREVAAAEAALHRAVLASDVKALEPLLDETFIWTHRTGEQQTRQALLEQLGSGQLKYSKLETQDVTIAVYGDTAIVRGVSPRQRSVYPGSGGAGDPAPFTAYYTLTFVNQGGAWRAVAMHSSRADAP